MTQKYLARFHGRLKGALGVTYKCESYTEGNTEEEARLALYATYEHISGLTLLPLALRYVVTFVNSDGTRALLGAAQGRHTYATPEEAAEMKTAILTNNSPARIREFYGDPALVEVRRLQGQGGR